MKVKILLLAATLTASVTAQVEHAPTVAQCQADQRLWFSRVESSVGTFESGDTLSERYGTLSQWRSEMTDCMEVDPENRVKYYNTAGEIFVVTKRRLTDFIERHGLWDKFIEEDAAGKH